MTVPASDSERVRCIARARSVASECPCPPCRTRKRRREHRRGYGLTDPYTSDDAWIVLDRMRTRGWTAAAIMSATGLPKGTITAVLSELGRGKRRRFFPGTAAAIVEHGTPTEGSVGSTGAVRRVRALLRYGYSRKAVAGAAGMTVETVNRVARGGRPRLDVGAATAVDGAFRALSGRPGRDWRTAEKASKAGWAPPYAWDGLDIDDPALVLPAYPRVDVPAKLLAREVAHREATARASAARQARRVAARTG